MSNRVVYTCVIGGYDGINQPIAVDSSFDYVCFVRKDESHPDFVGVWQIRNLPVDFDSNILCARWAKLNPHVLFPNCDYSLWLDGNVVVASNALYSVINDKIEQGVLFSGLNHPVRDCVYDEGYICAQRGFGGRKNVLRMLWYLKIHNFPRHFGLYETNVLFRKHTAPVVVKCNEMWWNFVYNYVNRDQLSNSYCLYKCGMAFDYLLPKEYSTHNHPYFIYIDHKKNHPEDSTPLFFRKIYMIIIELIVYGFGKTFKNRLWSNK